MGTNFFKQITNITQKGFKQNEKRKTKVIELSIKYVKIKSELMAEVYLIGQIHRTENFVEPNLFCKYSIQAGK